MDARAGSAGGRAAASDNVRKRRRDVEAAAASAAGPSMPAKPSFVVRGIYGEVLEEMMKRDGFGFDDRVFSIPRFGAAKYRGLSEERLRQQFDDRVASASAGSCLEKQRDKDGQSRLEQIAALAQDDCETWVHDVYRDVCSNPNPERKYKYTLLGETRPRTASYGNCNHMFTLLLDWHQVTNWLLLPMHKLNSQAGAIRPYLRDAPAAQSDADLPADDEPAPLLCAERLCAADRQRGELVAAFATAAARAVGTGQNRWSCRDNPVWRTLRSRLDLPFHAALSDESVFNTLTYLWNHMKCGVYIKIRQNKLAMFVPFHNLHYQNAWAEAAAKHLPGSKEFGRSLHDYYAEKHAIYKHEDILSDMTRWWANGNILCNVQVSDEHKRHQHFWGDQHLPHMKDMIQQTCATRKVNDCDFFLNKRDHPQLKSDLSEPYDFLYEKERPSLPREEHSSYAPILSFYTSAEFADVPFPCAEDWMAAIGEFFPPNAMPNFMRENYANLEQQIECDAAAAGKTTWEMKRATAVFRGSGTGGGNTPDNNQRLKLHKLSEDWAQDPRFNSENPVDSVPYLDAACTAWNSRDKKLKHEAMNFFDPHTVGMTKGQFKPMFEQVLYKYHIYAEGHCAANRYAQMMRSGCVIIKVASTCEASNLWFFPMLVPYQDHVPVRDDLSDLGEQIEWCKTHDQECRQIAEHSRRLYNELFSQEGIMDYCALIFDEISHRFSKGQRSTPAASFKLKVPLWERPTAGLTGLKPGDHAGQHIPAGWLECQEAGQPLLIDDNVLVLACKAPLGPQFGQILEPGSQFSPLDIVKYMRIRYSREVGLVINLSSTENTWYSKTDWPPYVNLVHLECGTLDGKAANSFCWEIIKHKKKEKNRFLHTGSLPRSIVVHCTHGYNRTGFMLCAYLLAACKQWHAINHTVQQVVAEFSRVRPPGICSHDVVVALHRLYCERMPKDYPCPTPPSWADVDVDGLSPESDGAASVAVLGRNKKMEHDDMIGEEIPADMAEDVIREVYKLIDGNAIAGARLGFPGNHPVNLTRGSMPNLNNQHMVTWKADGTRYLMLVMPFGSFLVSRNENERVRRVQIRCPRSDGSLHSHTLLDGELVVDTDKRTKQQRRRFLVYDILASGSDSTAAATQRFADRPFKERLHLISTEFYEPYARYRNRNFKFIHEYDRAAEEFAIRPKEFYSLDMAEKICRTLIPSQLQHEADGLIFQPAQAEYRPGACADLFKWKYPWRNSVDFFFQDGQLYLDGDASGNGKVLMSGMRVIVDPSQAGQPGQPAPGAWPSLYEGDTIECVWVNIYLLDPECGTAARAAGLRPDCVDGHGVMQLRPQIRTWVFLRHRAGKGANRGSTFNGIIESILHPIDQEELTRFCNEIVVTKRQTNFDVQNKKMMRHYDDITETILTTETDVSPCSQPLRDYHNIVKDKLIARFGHTARGAKVLDLAAGKGGDLNKWAKRKVSFLLGLDLSQKECNAANDRYHQRQKKGDIGSMQAYFRRETLGYTVRDFYTEVGHPSERFTVVSCMFALHYFFADAKVLMTLLETVSANLCEGGVFIGVTAPSLSAAACYHSDCVSLSMCCCLSTVLGCLPDGLKIKQLVEQCASDGVFRNSVLTIKQKWKGKAAPFGSNYSFAIADTVTDSHDDDGSEEPLAMLSSFVEQLAEKAGLRMVSNYGSTDSRELSQAGRALEALLDPADVQSGAKFKHFAPKFALDAQWHGLHAKTAADLAVASEVNATFVFQKLVRSNFPTSAVRMKSPAREFLADNRRKTCGTIPSVAIIVCFRVQQGQRREAELQEFIPHMRTMLEKLRAEGEIRRYHIFVIQQKGSQDLDGIKFNRGKLLNIGFEIAQEDFDSFVFHDVDLLPNDDLAPYYACVPTVPIHIAACWHQRGYTSNPDFFGGIVSFSKMHFLQVNGYPNNFWGWGGEDDVIMDRCTRQWLVPWKVTDGSLTDIEKNAEGETMDMDAKLAWLKRNAEWKCADRWERRAEDSRTWGMNGVATLHSAHQSYVEVPGQRQDISELGPASTAETCAHLEATQLGAAGTRIVVDLLFDRSDREHKHPHLEHEHRTKKRRWEQSI